MNPRPEENDPSELLAATGLVEGLVVAMLHCQTHRSEHPRVQAALAKIGRFLKKLGREGRAVELRADGSCFFFEGAALAGASLSASRLIAQLRARQAEGLRFETGATPGELLPLIRELSGEAPGQDTFPAAAARLAAAGCERIHLMPAASMDGVAPAGLEGVDAIALYQSLSQCLQEAVVRVGRGQSLTLGPAATAVAAAVEALEASPARLLETASYEQFDPLALGHSVRVCLLVLQTLIAGKVDRRLLCRAGMAALFHDIGMVQVPQEILASDRPLTEDERRIMEQHPAAGAAILAAAEGADPLAVAAAFGHHRSADGASGYPEVRTGDPPGTMARLVRICDVYEALTSPRPYKKKVMPPRACRILLEMGERLDRALLGRFLAAVGFYPPGRRVRLSDGSTAQVVRPGVDPAHPVVAAEAPAGGLAGAGLAVAACLP